MVKFLRGYTNLYLVDLSMRSKVYLIPPIAVHGPKPMSMWKTSAKFGGMADGVVFQFFDRIDAVSPGFTVGLLVNPDTE